MPDRIGGLSDVRQAAHIQHEAQASDCVGHVHTGSAHVNCDTNVSCFKMQWIAINETWLSVAAVLQIYIFFAYILLGPKVLQVYFLELNQ